MVGGSYTCDTLQFALAKRFARSLFLHASFDLQTRTAQFGFRVEF